MDMDTPTTHIVLANLSEAQLRMVLELCKSQKIHYTFDRDYYSHEDFDCFPILDEVIEQALEKNEKVPIVYKDLIEGQYRDVAEDNDEELTLERLEQIKYETSPIKKTRA